MVIWKVFSRSECYSLYSCVNKLETYQSFYSSAASFRLEMPPFDEFGICYQNLGPTSCFANTSLVLFNLILHNEHHQKGHNTNRQQTCILLVFKHLFFELYNIYSSCVSGQCLYPRKREIPNIGRNLLRGAKPPSQGHLNNCTSLFICKNVEVGAALKECVVNFCTHSHKNRFNILAWSYFCVAEHRASAMYLCQL